MFQSTNKMFITVAIFAAQLCAATASGNNLKIPDFYSEPGINAGRAYESGLGNEAIDPFSGGLLLQYQDMVLPGDGGLDIVINRTYRSLQGAEPILEQRQERRVTGIGWDIHFGRVWTSPNTVLCDTLSSVVTGPNLPASNRNPTFEAADGSRKVLVTEFSGSTPYHMISKDRWIATCLTAAQNPWSNIAGLEVQSPDGTKYTLGVRGRIEIGNQATNLPLLVNQIEDRHGNWLVIDYDTTTSSYALIDRIRASDGREVRFTYTRGSLPEDVRLKRITAYPGTPQERSWEYTYTQAQFTSSLFTSPWYLLTAVQSPQSEIRWRYSYYPDDPNGPDANGVYDPGRFSLKTITLPEGAVIEYQYDAVAFDTRPGTLGDDIDTTVVSRKVQRGDSIEDGTWDYDYRPFSVAPGALDALIGGISFPTLDETRVRGPKACTTYKHVGIKSISFNPGDTQDDGVWTVGLLLERKRYAGTSCSGTVLEKETLSWGKQQLSEQNEFRPSRSAIDENTYAPVMLAKTLQRDGTDYVTTFSNYDAYGNPQTVIEQGQDTRTTDFVYQPNLAKWLLKLVGEETVQGVGSITRVFDGNGNVTSEVKYGVPSWFTYYVTGDVSASQDARGSITQFNNYFRGVPRNEIRPENVTVNRVVNEAGNVISETNGRGKTTLYTYDLLNRITSISQPRGAQVTIARPNANESVLSRGGFTKRELRDGLGRIVTSISRDTVTGQNIQQTTRYDAAGDKVFESYPNSTQGTTTTYDALGRVLTQSQPGSVTTAFSHLDGNRVEVTDPRGKLTRFFYRAFGSPGERSLVRSESPESVTTDIDRNKLDLVTRIQQGSHQRSFIYDSRYYLDSETHPEVGAIQYTRDALGNKMSETYGTGASARTNLFAYDRLNRLVAVNYHGATPDIFYNHDANSNLVWLKRNDIIWTYGYDDNDNLISEQLAVGAQQFDLGYQYDTLDALSRITYPSGLAVDYAPNRYGWPTQASGFVTAVDYHPSGHIRNLHYANGVQQAIQLNNRLLPSSIAAPGIIDLSYSYDPSGNVTAINDALDPTNSVSMAYDNINRLTSANGAWGVGSFGYDVGGNLISKRIGAQTQAYAYNSTNNRLESVSGGVSAQLSYDVFGNVTSDGSRDYVYDNASDLVQVVGGHSFAYDGNRRRTFEQTPNTTLYTLYSQDGQLVYEYDEENLISKEYIRLGSNLIAIREDICDPTSTDTDGDGIPDCFENKVGLDANDPADGAADPDGDTLTNLQEFLNKTNLFHPDTDFDGLPDNFEVQFGLDPLTDDAALDADGDGFTNQEEYQGASDPSDANSLPNGSVAWSASVGGAVSFPAVADDGSIYLLAADGGVPTLYAFSEHGATLWSRVLPTTGACLLTSDALNGGGIVIGDEGVPPGSGFLAGQVAVSRTGTVVVSCDSAGTHAYDAVGNHLWSYAAGGYLAVTDSRVYVSPLSAPTGEIHALDSAQGTSLWVYVTALPTFGDSLVADAGERVYGVTGCNNDEVLLCENTSEVHAVDLDGRRRWVNRDAGGVTGKPAIGVDGSLYFGIDNGNKDITGVIAINADGTTQRRTTEFISSGGEVNPPTGPVIDTRGKVYIMPLSIRAYHPDLTRDTGWDGFHTPFLMNLNQYSPLLASDGGAYVALSRNWVFSYNSAGIQRWATSYVSGDTLSSIGMSPNGALIVVVSSPSGSTLHTLHNNGGRVISNSIWPMRGGNARQTRSIQDCPGLDQDGDGMTDCYERWIHSDPADPLDASLDFDADGLSNLEEFGLRTHPYNADTDGDTMPDRYEVQLGLDPRSNTSLQDSDGDGALDAIEARAGTDPTDPGSLPSPGTQLWSLATNAPVESAPAHHRDHGPVFTGVGEVGYLGDVNWTPGPVPVVPVTPLISQNDLIYSPMRGGSVMYAYRLSGRFSASKSFGTQLAPGSAMDSAGAIYFGYQPNWLQKITSLRNLQWTATLPADVTTAPAVNANDVVIVGTADGVVRAFDTFGTALWTFTTSGTLRGAPAIRDDGTVYIGSADGRLYALNSDTGALVWSFTVGAPISSAPVIGADGTVFATVEDGFVYAVNPVGTMQWSYQTGGTIRSNPVIGKGGGVYFGSDDGYVYALNADGTLNWRIAAGAPMGTSSPYIDDRGVLYVGTADNRLLGLYAGVRGLDDTPWPTLGHDPHRTGNVTTRLGVVDQPPTLSIDTPLDGQAFEEGTTVVLNAAVTDLEDGDLGNAVSWVSSLDGPLGVGASVAVSTLSVGQHTLTATVSDSAANTVSQSIVIDVQQAAVVVTLGTDVASPQTEGGAVTVSATVSDLTRTYEYRFRVKGDATGNTWVVLNDYSPQANVLWDTTGYRGRNRLQVSVREAGSTDAPINSGKTFWVNGVDAAQAVTLASDLDSPQVVGEIVTLSASASGGPGPYTYRFEVRSVTRDEDWQLLQDYSSQTSVSWDTAGYSGKNRLRVFARLAGSPDKPVKQARAFWVNAPNAATAVDLTLTPGGDQPGGTLIQLDALGQGGSGTYTYEFQLKGPSTGDKWQVLQAHSALASYVWDTTGLTGAYRVRVRAKNAGTDDKPVNRGRNVTLQ